MEVKFSASAETIISRTPSSASFTPKNEPRYPLMAYPAKKLGSLPTAPTDAAPAG
jgi:hypothetical protein